MLTRTREPAGNRRYWPIYEAAERHGLPVAMHVFGAGGHPYTGAGWPSFYIEEGAGHSTSCQTVVTSLVIEGVFERFPTLKVVIVEGGFGWLPALTWRLDKLFERMRGEVPHLKRRPSEYIREHIWVTTQPMEEPDDRRQLLDMMEWIGWDRLLFATDYPHWDFDDPVPRLPGRACRASATSRSSPPMRARCIGWRRSGAADAGTSLPGPPRSRPDRASSCTWRAATSSSSTSGRAVRALGQVPAQGRQPVEGQLTGVVSSSEPGDYDIPGPARSSAVRGTTGSSTCARVAPGAIPSACG